jgi:hypothetical protein
MKKALARSRLLAPLVYVVALVLLFEEWCWETGARLGGRIAAWLSRWSWVAALEARVSTLPPYCALCLFILPGLLLLPVKLLALFAIAHGHALSGIATIVVAKVGGAALVARLYTLTLPTLLGIPWFARSYAWFMLVKTRSIERLRASPAAQLSVRLARTARITLRRLLRRLRRAGARPRARLRNRALRLLRRFAWQWRRGRPMPRGAPPRRRPPTRNLP